jgi:hypothetical protein
MNGDVTRVAERTDQRRQTIYRVSTPLLFRKGLAEAIKVVPGCLRAQSLDRLGTRNICGSAYRSSDQAIREFGLSADDANGTSPPENSLGFEATADLIYLLSRLNTRLNGYTVVACRILN